MKNLPKTLSIFLKISLLVLAFSIKINAQSKSELAIIATIKAETDAYYQADAKKYETVWIHDDKISQTYTGKSGQDINKGWGKIVPPMVPYIKTLKPSNRITQYENVSTRENSSMAFVEYDQIQTKPTDNTYKRTSLEFRLLVKEKGIWKLANQITTDPDTCMYSLKAMEGNLNDIAYLYLKNNEAQKAIEIFKLNTSFYSNSWNVYDSLGEAYAQIGETKLAIENYEKSISLNPKNSNGIEVLKKLKN